MESDSLTAMEKIPTRICRNSKEAVRWVAQEIAELIRSRGQEGKPCVLGLATGSIKNKKRIFPAPFYQDNRE